MPRWSRECRLVISFWNPADAIRLSRWRLNGRQDEPRLERHTVQPRPVRTYGVRRRRGAYSNHRNRGPLSWNGLRSPADDSGGWRRSLGRAGKYLRTVLGNVTRIRN